MVASHDFAEFLREQLAPLGRVTMRRMFGKTGVFCDGLMLGMVRDNTLYFRVDDGNRAVFKEAESYPMSLSRGRKQRWQRRVGSPPRKHGMLRGACHRAAIRPTRWRAMTTESVAR